MKLFQVTGVVAASVLALGVLVTAQAPAQGAPAGQAPQGGAPTGAPGQGRQGMPGGGRMGGGAGGAQASPFGKPLLITGDNPGLQLRLVAGGPIVAEVNYWRVGWSPVGSGHVCYVMTGDGTGKDDLRLALTDSDALEKYVTIDTMSKLVPNFGTPPYKVVKATFSTEGDSINEHSELCTSPQYKVKATWRKMNPGNWGSMQPGAFFMMFNIQMAGEAEITINGKKQPGQSLAAGPNQRPASYLAFSETWVKLN